MNTLKSVSPRINIKSGGVCIRVKGGCHAYLSEGNTDTTLYTTLSYLFTGKSMNYSKKFNVTV